MTDKCAGGFETRRLAVQGWQSRLSDAQKRQNLIADLGGILTPNVMRHLPDVLQVAPDAQAIDGWISNRAAESSVMTITAKETGDLIGLLILARFSEPGAPVCLHLGYLFAETTWGKGYASEVLSGLIAWLRRKGQPVQLLGGVEIANPASAKVLQKNGFEKLADLSGTSATMFSLKI